MSAIDKYQKRNPLTYPVLPSPPQKRFTFFIIIPAMAELDYIFETLDSLARNHGDLLATTMLLIVVNNRPDSDQPCLDENQALLHHLQNREKIPGNLNLYWIDASSPGCEIRRNPGVGAARKLGMDACLGFAGSGQEPLLCCLDADSPVDENYLSAVNRSFRENRDWKGAVINYCHQRGRTAEEDNAITDYELFLRQYENGLSFAGSPYAYHSIGSTIVCRLEAYVKCAGMRVREAGEDFYFLQALRKIGEIGKICDTCVHPSPRPSGRVPFGTGPKIREIMAGESPRFYNPACFSRLKNLIETIDAFETEDLWNMEFSFQTVFDSEVVNYLNSLDFAMNWQKIRTNTPADKISLRQAFHTWFDAFRTLKFFHFCEEHYPARFPRVDGQNAFSFLDVAAVSTTDKKGLLAKLRFLASNP